MKLKNACPIFLLFITVTIASAKIKHPATGEQPVSTRTDGLEFIENKGQWVAEAKYMAGVPGGHMFITDKGFVYNYENMQDEENYHHAAEAGKDVSSMIFRYHAYKVNFVGANKDIQYQASQKSTRYNNYFIGNDKSLWASNVGIYGIVNQHNVYDGIDVSIYSKGHSLKYDFSVAPGADVSQIKLSFEGVSPEITKDGHLKIVTSVNEVMEQAPYTYQVINGKQKEIPSRYKLSKGILSYELLEDYDHTKALIIDPVLVFATYSGATGNGAYYAYSTTYDAFGNTYAAGLTSNTAWPTTVGAYQTTLPGTNSVCINKYNASGSTLIYSTYFGGNSATQPNALRCNSLNELVMVGAALASDLPTTVGAYDNTFNGVSDLYIARFSVDGASLIGCTYIGGNERDGALLDIFGATNPSTQSSLTSPGVLSPCELNFDDADNIWIVSNSESANFPTTANAFQAANAGGNDGIVCRISADCSTLMYSSYYGGTGNDALYGIDFLSNGFAAVVGGSQSNNISTTANTVHPTASGGWDGYIGIINPNQNTLIASSYLGTASDENAAKLHVDGDDNIYVAGRTRADGTYPITTGVYSIPNGDVYIDKLNSTLTTSLLSTRVGNSENPTSTSSSVRYLPTAFLLDICENTYVAGLTPNHASPNLPTTADAFTTDSRPFWFCVLEPDFNALLFASFYGIGGNDHPHCGTSRLDPQGIVYHSFCSATNGANSVGTPGAWSELKQNTSNDIYTYKFNFEATGVNSNFVLDPAISGNDTGCAPYQVHFLNNSTSAEAFTWNFGDGSPTTNLAEPTHTYTAAGTYTISLHASNPESCITDDTAFFTITVLQVDPPDFDVHDTVLCTLEQAIHVGATIHNPSAYTSIEWTPQAGIIGANNTADITVDPTQGTVYNVTVKNTAPGSICSFEDTKTVTIDLAPRILDILNADTVVCEGAVIPIIATGGQGYTYRWIPSTGVSDSTALNPTITINQPEVYTLTGSYVNCPDTTVIINIGMQYMPHVTISEDKQACRGTEVTLESAVTPFRNDYIYNWTPVTGLTHPTGPNTRFIADDNITYILTVQTPIGCTDADTVNIIVFPVGFGSISTDTGYCSGTNGAVNLWASGGTSYLWNPSTGLSDANIANPVASPEQTTEYTVLIKDANNCLDTESVTVRIYPAAIINLPDSVNVYPGENYQIQPATNALYFSWFPPSGLDNTMIADPRMSPIVNTRYFVTATTENGCVIKDSVDIIVKETVLEMPNAFKPGGANPVFKPSKRGIAKLNSFTIYNRWGNKVYSSTNIDEGWDGTYNNVPQPLGVYVYVIDAVTDSGKIVNIRGNVTLLR